MMRFFTLFFLLLSCTSTAQLIKGQIFIFGSEDPLPSANVYFDGMYRGAISGEDGTFQLQPSASVKAPIIVSAVGYHSTSIADYTSEEYIKIYLQPKVYSLDAVVVTYDGMSREEKEAIFKREFIGISENSLRCEILNMDDINLVYNRKRSSIEAFAKEPIQIYNKALGFKITYYMEQFKYSPGNIFFSGNYYFEPDSTLEGKQLLRVEKKRKEAYLGSRMHFIRSLYNDMLKKDGFSLLKFSSEPADYSGLVVDREDGRSIFLKSRIAVVYKGNHAALTFLDNARDFTFISENGFYDPTGIIWSGSMANQRMGDLLPFEYVLPVNRKR